jgi:hypothetical protein
MPVLALPAILGITAAGTGIAGTIIGAKQAGAASDAQDKALKAQEQAQKQAQAQTVADARRSDTANNEASKKTPDVSAILARAAQSGKAGLTGTMLTGPMGVSPNSLSLGKSTLLGS